MMTLNMKHKVIQEEGTIVGLLEAGILFNDIGNGNDRNESQFFEFVVTGPHSKGNYVVEIIGLLEGVHAVENAS